MAKASDARLAQGRGAAPLEGMPLGIKDLFCTEGVAHHRRLEHPRGLQAALRMHRHRQPVARRRGDARQAQHGRVRHGLVERDQRLRPGDHARGGATTAATSALDARAARRAARRRRSRRGICARRDRHRHRRLDPPARGLHRHLSASSRPTAAARAGASSPSPRSLDQAGPMARTVRDCAILLEAMAGFDPKDSTSLDLPVPEYEAAVVARRQGPARSAFRRNIGSTACRPRSRRCGSRASNGCKRRRRRDRRDPPAAHQIRAAGLLHHRAGRGLVQPRPL